eukprot:CAMPEP_0171103196 /NCGR_PEP_ID=MMETSP0766_2-20121228/58790_1 /TAXON_ID=439317 /ORGANISM="Gambierdiscus australes, Strain CAWD 149" /LENGTH=47 /DNA_ID= /DNA_START= /DNA_END= /DNA_ORIENTATION=
MAVATICAWWGGATEPSAEPAGLRFFCGSAPRGRGHSDCSLSVRNLA